MSGKLRLRFGKAGRAKYISHLDLMSTMRRALLRAGIELKYSEGFNPHPYMSVALPLSVGSSSICELMDIGVANDISPDGLPEAINPVLPDGLEVSEAYIPERKFSEIAWVGISGSLYYDAGTPQDIAEKLTARFSVEHIIISKKTKSGISDIDISPYIRDTCFSRPGEVVMSARISAQNPSINPDNLISALNGGYEALMPDFHDFTRIEIFDKDMNIFR
jgi:radical SAM-linked protein